MYRQCHDHQLQPSMRSRCNGINSSTNACCKRMFTGNSSCTAASSLSGKGCCCRSPWSDMHIHCPSMPAVFVSFGCEVRLYSTWQACLAIAAVVATANNDTQLARSCQFGGLRLLRPLPLLLLLGPRHRTLF